MNLKVIDPAIVEFNEAIEYYNLQESELGYKFSDCVELAFARIIDRPEWNIRVDINVYRIRVKLFPYKIYYFIDDGEIVIIAILHNHRKPRLWKNRK